jgi:hypothetical protein
MAKITLAEPDGPYSCLLDTEVMEVKIREAYIGVEFITNGGAILSVSMRDDGFEVHYFGRSEGFYFDSGRIECKNQVISRMFPEGKELPDEVFLKAIFEDENNEGSDSD